MTHDNAVEIAADSYVEPEGGVSADEWAFVVASRAKALMDKLPPDKPKAEPTYMQGFWTGAGLAFAGWLVGTVLKVLVLR